MKLKKIKYSLIYMLLILFMGACSLEENPSFPSEETLFNNREGLETVLNGCYSSVANYNYYGADFHYLTDMSSGLYNTNRDGSLKDIAALNPPASLNFVENVWKAFYITIARSNDLISGVAGSALADESEINDILGQAYFLRSFTYFNLVRLYGKGPLITEKITSSTINYPMSTSEEIYAQVIADAEKAYELLSSSGFDMEGRPNQFAAKMLLTKVYMTLAGNGTAGETEYWQKAYDEAIQVYGEFNLVPDYRTLWFEETSNNTGESIFEVQANIENTLNLIQIFTASSGVKGRTTWGRLKPNLEVYDLHDVTYPEDPRFHATFHTEWTKYKANGSTSIQKTYPKFKKRNNKDNSYPWSYKYYAKDHTIINFNSNMNLVVYRYADLLLMLAEIENELNGPENAYQYVNEVLARARQSADIPSVEPQDWSGMTQEEFRVAIMHEYQFELLTEGQDWFTLRRRGYEYYKTNVIDVHNNHPKYDFTILRDVEYPDNDRIMLMPIPASEITANPNISANDQNSGY